MALFIAHYRSPDASADRALGSFEFESGSRLGSKANSHDARVRMLELFGNDALGWTIDKIEHRKMNPDKSVLDGQLEMDFRDAPEIRQRKRKRSVKRGLISH